MPSIRPKSANVLFIEDEPGDWPTILSDIVRPVKCKFDVKSNDGATLGWIAETDIGSLYDLVICNLKNRAAGHLYGKIIIRELRTRFPDLPVVVLTGEDPQTATELHRLYTDLYATYKVSYVAFKRADNSSDEKFDLTMFRDKFLEALQAKTRLPEVESDSPQPVLPKAVGLPQSGRVSLAANTYEEMILPGVADDIVQGLRRTASFSDITNRFRNEISHLVLDEESRRIHFAVQLWKSLWLEEVGLPYLTLIDKLAEEEFSGGPYPEYRDHVAHSIWVFLLGLFLYEHNRAIRDAIQNKLTEVRFLSAWRAAALFHDIGYTCDRGIDREDEFVQPILVQLQRFTDFPLLEHLKPRGFVLSEPDEESLARISGRHTPLKVTLDSIELRPLPGPDRAALEPIEHFAIPTRLAQSGQLTPLWNYYLLGRSIHPEPEVLDRFRDHGVLSALLLLHQFDRLDHCLKSLQGKPLPERISRETRAKLAELILGTPSGPAPVTQQWVEAVHQAAAAMALHNLRTDIWNHEKAKQPPYHLSLPDFGIALEESPLAFLLALCDILQCWDRPKRRFVTNAKDFTVRAQDVRIVCEGDRIVWSVKPDPTAGQQLVKPRDEIQAMSRYMIYRGSKDLSFLLMEVPM